MAACSHASAEIEIWRGANDPAVIWDFLTETDAVDDLTGMVFELEIELPAIASGLPGGPAAAATIRHASNLTGAPSPLTVEPSIGRVSWAYSVEESRRIPRNRGTTYTLFRVTPEGRRRAMVGGPISIKSYSP